MIRLIDETAEDNTAWIHAVDVGHDFLTFWTKTRRREVDEKYPEHNAERYHAGQKPQDWIEETWPGKRWAAHFHLDLKRVPSFTDCGEFVSEMSAELADKLKRHFRVEINHDRTSDSSAIHPVSVLRRDAGRAEAVESSPTVHGELEDGSAPAGPVL